MDVNQIIKEGTKRYGSKNAFLSSEEYRSLYPKLQHQRVCQINSERKRLACLGKQAMQESNVKIGDSVEYLTANPFGQEFQQKGKVVLKNGIPHVNLKINTIDKRKVVRWHKGFEKI